MQLKQHSAFDSLTGDWLASICLQRTPFISGSKYQHFTWGTLESLFLKFFLTEMHHRLITVLVHYRDWHTHPHPRTQRAMASSQYCPMFLSTVLSLGLTQQSTHRPVSKNKEQTKRNSQKTEHAIVFLCQRKPDFPHKKCMWSWSLSAEWIKKHRYFQPLKRQHSYFILYVNIYPGITWPLGE